MTAHRLDRYTLEKAAELCEQSAYSQVGENYGERVSWNHAAMDCADRIRVLAAPASGKEEG